MPRRTPDQGVRPFELRPGQDFKRLRGINRSADPASIPDDQLHLLANVRLTPKGMIDRPGLLASFHTSEEGAGCITGMIEVEDAGVGIIMTPSLQWDDPEPEDPPVTFPGDFQLAIFNEEKSGTVDYGEFANRADQRADFRRYGYTELLDPPGGAPNGIIYPITRLAPTDPNDRPGTWTSLLKYRKRLLQFGWRTFSDPAAADAGDTITKVCLWQIELPEREEVISAGYQVYADLWRADNAFDVDDLAPTSAVSVFGRADDPQTGEELIQEILYIGRVDGKVFSYDGTTVREEWDFGTDIIVRLQAFNGIGILAIGSDPATPHTTTVARFLDAPGGTWSNVAVPAIFDIGDMISFGGAIYIASAIPSGNPGAWTGGRIYKFNGTTISLAFELTNDDPAFDGIRAPVGLLFIRSGMLHVVYGAATASGEPPLFAWRRVTDGNWINYNDEITTEAGSDSTLYWVLVTGGNRVIMGGPFGGEDEANHEINELVNWSVSGGPDKVQLYSNDIPLEEGPTVGKQVLVVAPEDIALNEEEL